MRCSLLAGSFAVAAGLLVGSSAHASQIFLCQPSATQPCTSAPGGTAIGGESNLITTPGSFDIGAAGGFTLQNPLLVGVAIPNNGSGTASISFGASHTNASLATAGPNGGIYGLGTNTVTSFTATTGGGDVFDALGLPQGGGSISFGNLVSADFFNGFGTPTSYLLEVFAVPTNLTSGTPLVLDTGAGPGSFIFAYDCHNGTGTNNSLGPPPVTGRCGTNGNGDLAQTVNTNIGLISGTTVPEPATLAIFGTALAGLGLIRRRRRKGM